MSEHDQTERQLRDLYRDSAGETPPPELDRRILDAAAAAAQRRRRRFRGSLGGAAAGFATAAVVMLAVAVLLRQPAPQPPTEALPRSPEAPATDPSTVPQARKSLDERDRPRSAIEEVVVTGVVRERSAGVAAADAAADRAAATEQPAAAPQQDAAEPLLDAAPSAPGPAAPLSRPAVRTAAFAAPECAEPFPLPAGAVLRMIEGGLQVSVNGETYELRCIDGAWARQDQAPQSNR